MGKFHRAIGVVVFGGAIVGALLLGFAITLSAPSATSTPSDGLLFGVWQVVYDTQAPSPAVILAAIGLALVAAAGVAIHERRISTRDRRSDVPHELPLAPKVVMRQTHGVFAGPVTVTVLIPAHNEEACIGETIRSLQRQSHRPDRIIVVADNCVDRTPEIARAAGVEVFASYANTQKKIAPGPSYLPDSRGSLTSGVKDQGKSRGLPRRGDVDRSGEAPVSVPDLGALLRDAKPLVGGTAAPRVAVITANPDPCVVAEVQRTFPDATAHPYDAAAGLAELHLGLAAHGRFDLVLDLAGSPEAAARFRLVFFHLAPNGGLVTWLGPAGDQGGAPLRKLLRRLDAARAAGGIRQPRSSFAGPDARGPRRRQFDAMAFSLVRLDIGDSSVVAVSKGLALAKVREHDMNRLLAERAGADRVVQTIPAEPFPSRCVARSSSASSLARLPTSFEAPELSLREYHEVLCRRYQIATQGNLVLPESFRHTMAPRLRNRALADWAPDFVREPLRASRLATPLPGAYFYLDNEAKNHFGHFVSELISRLWGWEQVKRVDPTARVLVPMSPGDHQLAAWEYDFLEAAGILREDLVLTNGPVRVETLYTASAMFSMPSYAHPRIEELWTGIGDRLDARAPARPYPTRLFCSRRVGKRRCRNAEEVEDLFREHGFEVVFPEDHPIAEQVRMFRRAEVVAGYAGSALFSAAFAGAPRHLITIRPESYTAINEYLICSVLGHRLDEVVCRADLAQPERGWDWNAFNSDFTLDIEREGAFLRTVLREL